MRTIIVAESVEEPVQPYMGNAALMRQLEPEQALAFAWISNCYRLITNPGHLSASNLNSGYTMQSECTESLFDGTLEFWCSIARVDFPYVFNTMYTAAKERGLV